MQSRHFLSTLFTIVAAAVAQSETSPKGYLTTEGSSKADSMFGYYSTSYAYGTGLLQIDETNAGQARTIKQLSMRRDGPTASNNNYLARTVKMSVRMARADWSKVKAYTPQDDGEFMITGWTTVMSDKTISLPDFAIQPVSGTAPFNVLMPLDSQFAYNGTNALAFHILCSPNAELVANSTSYPIDSVYEMSGIAKQEEFGKGCIASGNSQPMGHNSYLVNYGPNGTNWWTLAVSHAPSNAPVVIVLGRSNPNLAFGACEKLFAQPDFTLSGIADAGGDFGLEFKFPHQAQFIGAKFYSQGAAFDAGIMPPIAMSFGMSVVYPADPIQPKVARSSVLVPWGSAAWPTNHTFFRGSAIVFGLHE